MFLKSKVAEEAKTSKTKRDDWGYERVTELFRAPQDCPVATQSHNIIYLVFLLCCEFVKVLNLNSDTALISRLLLLLKLLD